MSRFARLYALLLVAVSLSSSFGDWPQWRGSARDGIAEDSPPLIDALPDEGLKPVWLNREAVAHGRGEGWSSPIVANGRVFYFGHGRARETKREGENEARAEHVVCLDAKTGEELWRKEFASGKTKFPQSGTPAVVDGKLYLLGAGLVVRCLSAESGEQVWSTQLPGDVNEECWDSSPAVADGVVCLFAGRLFGLYATSGEVRWQGDDTARGDVNGSPAVYGVGDRQLLVAHVGGGQTVAVEPTTGKERWRVKTEAVNSTPVVHGDLMLTLGSSRKGGLRCYRIGDDKAEKLWEYSSIADPGSSPVVVGEHVYVQGERKLACVDLATGKAAWTTEIKAGQPRYTSLIAADGKLLYAFDRLSMFAAGPQQCSELFEGRFDTQGLIASEAALRRIHGVEGSGAEDEKQAQKKWREKVGDAGPHTCTSPAIADGFLYLRLKQGLACYDLRSQQSAQR
jgi:outer membrane protein assembly factor BamB